MKIPSTYTVTITFEVESYASADKFEEKINDLLQDGIIGDAFNASKLGAQRFSVKIEKVEE